MPSLHAQYTPEHRRASRDGNSALMRRYVNVGSKYRYTMKSRVFITDWDETATVKDTTGLIAGVASRTDCAAPPFSHFSKIYSDSYSSYIASTRNGCGKRDTINAEETFQRGMRAVEYSSIHALEDSGYFQGFHISKFYDLATKIELQPGFISFMKQAACPVYILSVNWCKGLIETVLRLHGIHDVTVLANDLQTDKEGVTTGRFDRNFDIRTGYDKAVELEKIRSLYTGSKIFYFGDSSGDVLPILKADYGGIIHGGRGRPILKKLSETYMLCGENAEFDATRVFEASWAQLEAAWTGA
ncbi:hypothetical protein OXX80_006204 [Metschnikowia pulcherrima]